MYSCVKNVILDDLFNSMKSCHKLESQNQGVLPISEGFNLVNYTCCCTHQQHWAWHNCLVENIHFYNLFWNFARNHGQLLSSWSVYICPWGMAHFCRQPFFVHETLYHVQAAISSFKFVPRNYFWVEWCNCSVKEDTCRKEKNQIRKDWKCIKYHLKVVKTSMMP